MRYGCKFIVGFSVICLVLAACGSERTETQKPESHSGIKETAAAKQDKPPVAVCLKLSAEILQDLTRKQKQAIPLAPAWQKDVAEKQQRKIQVGGSVLLNRERQGIIEKVDGAKVELTVPFK